MRDGRGDIQLTPEVLQGVTFYNSCNALRVCAPHEGEVILRDYI